MNWQFAMVVSCVLVFNSSFILSEDRDTSGPQTVRCAVIGGLHDTGLWTELSTRFERETGHKVLLGARGPKHEIVGAFTAGEADLITMHTSDTIMNLVADGYGSDPQPWVKNDFVLVGPPDDPAGIRGERSAVAAIRKLVESKAKVLLHRSQGASEVLGEVLAAADLEFDGTQLISLPTDRHRQMLVRARELGAYTIVGRVPFLGAKLPAGDMQIMVQGDPLLRRPYVVVVANSADGHDPRRRAAQQLAAFLRAPATQAWLKEFGRGEYDDQPLFFPIATERPVTPARAAR